MSEDVMSGAHLESDEELKVYELGYLIVPTVPEEHLGAEVQKLKEVITAKKGTFVSEDFPKLRTLAYTITKHVGGRNIKCDRAYFGWLKFSMPAENSELLKNDLDRNGNVLRYLHIKTVKESTLFTGRQFGSRTDAAPIQAPKKVQKEELTETSMAQIDKEIEGLVIE